ncbi:MAG TPA: hypothetical protein DCS67_01990, partial [Clostridiales bacterium UBA8960]|nr:hypothetical protein [Clostridiales bacterium UBA8960]
MIIKPCEAEALYDLAREDIARNYFICYTIDNKQPYDKVWRIDKKNMSTGESTPVMGVFLRKTGLVQMAVKPDFSVDAYSVALKRLLSEIRWTQANVSEHIMNIITTMGFNVSTEKAA